jgi:hypothetical protein
LRALEKEASVKPVAECFRDRRVSCLVSEFDRFLSQLIQQSMPRSVQYVVFSRAIPVTAPGSELDWSAAIDLHCNWRIDTWAAHQSK